MSIQLPKPIKNIIRHHAKDKEKSSNIFQNSSALKLAFDANSTYYSVVGDREFKKKYLQEQGQGKQKETKNQPIKQYDINLDTNQNTTYCNHTRTIEEGTLRWKLSNEKQNELSRQHRTFEEFRKNRSRDEKINLHLKQRLSHFGLRPVSNTITFQRQQFQISPNPELIDLINDNIPEYWKNSLRDNEKRLKRHIKGNTFKLEVAEQMLQTLKGRRKLAKSIPKLKQDMLSPICTRNDPRQSRHHAFSLKGRSPKLLNRSDSEQKNNAIVLPDSKFDQVYKIRYESSFRWMASELC